MIRTYDTGKQLEDDAYNAGHIVTNDLFIVPSNLYVRYLQNVLKVEHHPHDVVVRRSIQYDLYFNYNYTTGVKKYIDRETYYTQFNVYKFLKETDEDFIDTVLNDILDYNLSPFALRSEHLF